MNYPGIGPQLRAKLLAKFESKAGFEQALDDANLEELLEIDGVSEKRAIQWIHQYRGNEATVFAATHAAEQVQQSIIDRIESYGSTRGARMQAKLLQPLSSKQDAEARMREVMQWKQTVQELPRKEIRAALKKLKPLQEPKPILNATTLIVAESNEAYETLHGKGIGKWASLGTKRDLEQMEQYDEVLIAYDDGHMHVPDGAEELPATSALYEFCPHAAQAWMQTNHETLEALQELAKLLDEETAVPEAPKFSMGPIPTSSDLTRFCWSLGKELDEEVREKTANLALTGAELLESMTRGGFPKRLEEIVNEILKEGEAQIRMEYGISMQPFEAGIPIEVSESKIDDALQQARRQQLQSSVKEKRGFAKTLEQCKAALQDEVQKWQIFDQGFALGCYAFDHDLQPFTWSTELQFEDGKHLELLGIPSLQPISYQIGGKTPIAVLTGANSGGKSTLLELITQVNVLARLGFPVPATNASVPWMDEIHLVTANKGLDAGAFETFLRGFLPIVQGDKRRLVLADEVEAVTELQAASRILGFVMDELSRTDSFGVIVTHLAEQILAQTETVVRVDGIEAVGLDENHQLIVERCPKLNQFARSTPELIIQRMANLSTGGRKELYESLLGRFQGPLVNTPI